MSQTASGSDLYTVVKNISGKSLFFGYLGSRGKQLAVNEVYSQPGNLVNKLGASRKQRQFTSLINDLDNGNLLIRSSPAHYVWDAVQNRVRKVAINNDQLGTVDPSWEATGSSTFTHH